jgi:putative ATP-dependent endonuclease of the OLD family
MHITRVYINGFKRLNDFDLELDPTLNVIVGDNETGKTSVLEAIRLALSRQYEGRSIDYSLDPYLFNTTKVADFIRTLRNGGDAVPPRILIEVYLCDDPKYPELAHLKGSNNEKGEDCPGLSLSIEVDNDYGDALKEYVRDKSNPDLLPVEYYKVTWRSFADNGVNARNIPLNCTMIDTSLTRAYRGPDRYVAQLVSGVLTEEQRRRISLAYKKLRHGFAMESDVAAINKHLKEQGSIATKRNLTVQMDVSSRSTWDSAITAHLDDLPFDCAGKGEQCRVQMRLAIADAAESRVLLIEEPENHLSHSKMNMLMEEITQLCGNQQVIVSTHSAFVLNKLGIDKLKLISASGTTAAISGLKPDTRDYFMKLPGYDTLRLVLAKRSILVEGPSDELVVQRAYKDKHGKLPAEDGVDVISVGSLAFKRFLEIATLLRLDVHVVTDNDGDVARLKEKYRDYLNGRDGEVRIFYDEDEQCKTLEPQLLKANSLKVLSKILGGTFKNTATLLVHMENNKTDCALRLFETKEHWSVPEYIANAIN